MLDRHARAATGFVRVSTIRLPQDLEWNDSIDEAFKAGVAAIQDDLHATHGQVWGFWWRDETRARLIAAAIWDSVDALDATEQRVRAGLERIAGAVGGEVLSVERFDVVSPLRDAR